MAFIAAAAILCHLAFSWMGFNPTDDGYVLAAARRVLDGQVPYRDFTWMHGPGSPYLHAPVVLWGGAWTLWWSRGVVWLEWAAIAWSWTRLAERLGGRGFGRGGAAAVATTALALGAHTFPVTAWFSTDALLAASAGLALAARGGSVAGPAGWALVGASALFRQNFALLGPAALAITGAWRRPGAWVALAVPGALAAAALAAAGALGPALPQVGAIDDVVRLAVHPFVYFEFLFPVAVQAGFWAGWAATSGSTARVRGAGRLGLAAAVAAACMRFGATGRVDWAGFGLWWTAAGALAALRPGAAARPARAAGWLAAVCAYLFAFPPFRPWEVALLAVIAWAGWRWIVLPRGKRLATPARAAGREQLGALALVAGWSAAISMGYTNPILAAGAPVAFLAALGRPPAGRRPARGRLAAAVAAVAFVAFVAARCRFIYRERPCWELTRPLGAVLAGGRGIRTDASTWALLADLNRAVRRAGPGPVAIIPDFAAYWIRSPAANPLPTDWVAGVEMRDPALLAPVYRVLASPGWRGTVLLQAVSAMWIARGPEPLSGGGYHDAAAFVRLRFRRVAATDGFALYR